MSLLPYSSRIRSWLGGVVLAAAVTSLGGCGSMIDFSGTSAITAKAVPTGDGDLRADAEEWGKQYDSDPGARPPRLITRGRCER